jgi:hypothetical protein
MFSRMRSRPPPRRGRGFLFVPLVGGAPPDPTRATREIAERLLPNLVPKITGQLPRLFQ